jgi:ubiquinone/menaquinone biosynthesis C-methylase UbiE
LTRPFLGSVDPGVDPTRRFSDRAGWYASCRPGYPRGIIKILEKEIGFRKLDVVADIASGTGLLTKVFLENGNRVFGVEPNQRMRSYAERDLKAFGNFVSVVGTAEHTSLPQASVDLLTVGQALHWFDPTKAVKEFSRIAKPRAHLCIAYNERKADRLGRAYEEVVRRNQRDRAKETRRSHEDAHILRFFAKSRCSVFTLRNIQTLDFEGLMGRFLSASYLPTTHEKERFAAMRADVERLFAEFNQEGRVRLRYATKLYVGQVRTV